MARASSPRLQLCAWLLSGACALLACNKGSREGEPSAPSAPAASAAPEPAAAAAAAPVTPPALPVRSLILDPSFVGKGASFAAGTAFPVRAPNAPGGVVVLSCHHIFGPAGGLAADIEASALPAFIEKASVTDRNGKTLPLGPALLVPKAKAFVLATRDASGDVSVFQAPPELAPSALELAPALPEKGERLWLLARVEGQTELMWPAVAFFVSDTFLVYQFDTTELNFRATSGAPVVNAKGQLVAINLGGNPYEGVIRGFGNPVPGIRSALDAAVSAKQLPAK